MNLNLNLNVNKLLLSKVISIDIGSYETKFIEGKFTKKGVEISNHFSCLTPEGAYENGNILDKDVLSFMLKEQLDKNKSSTDIVYTNIKSSLIITREITIPLVDEKQIAGIIKYQANEYLPMDSGEYIIQHKVIGVVKDQDVNKLNVLIIAAPKAIVENHFSLLKDLKLKPKLMGFQSDGVSKILKYNRLINGRFKTDDVTFATIDLGYHNTNVTVSRNNILYLSRVVEMGSKDIDEMIASKFEYSKEEIEKLKRGIENISEMDDENNDDDKLISVIRQGLAEIIEKIEIIFRYFDSRNTGNKINTILLYGGLSKINGINDLFSKYFGIPSATIDRLDKVFLSEDVTKYLNCISPIIKVEELMK